MAWSDICGLGSLMGCLNILNTEVVGKDLQIYSNVLEISAV
jgi:hypothetical protein